MFKKFFFGLFLFLVCSNFAEAQELLNVKKDIELVNNFSPAVIYQGGIGKKTLITDIFVEVTEKQNINYMAGFFSVNFDYNNYWLWPNIWMDSLQLYNLDEVGEYMKLPLNVHKIIDGDQRLWFRPVSIPYFNLAQQPSFKVSIYVFGIKI